ncbi:hypothetical protein H0I39_06435 [Ottowia beijingensis]|uniref:Uncharacterized protein n=1 Tax=Ottowia beijingensis TaxID=1207057 RepID=A0A853IUH3_9BURK|nr:hypothetical protein [Ottowia beijingensis]NZA01491.1 hypothetical protein [Ottowia beijingensis]
MTHPFRRPPPPRRAGRPAGRRRAGAGRLRRAAAQDTRAASAAARRSALGRAGRRRLRQGLDLHPARLPRHRPAKDYRKRFNSAGQWRGAQIHQATCEAERCTVRIRLTTRVIVPPFAGQDIVGAIDEQWVREDGQWWFYQAL